MTFLKCCKTFLVVACVSARICGSVVLSPPTKKSSSVPATITPTASVPQTLNPTALLEKVACSDATVWFPWRGWKPTPLPNPSRDPSNEENVKFLGKRAEELSGLLKQTLPDDPNFAQTALEIEKLLPEFDFDTRASGDTLSTCTKKAWKEARRTTARRIQEVSIGAIRALRCFHKDLRYPYQKSNMGNMKVSTCGEGNEVFLTGGFGPRFKDLGWFKKYLELSNKPDQAKQLHDWAIGQSYNMPIWESVTEINFFWADFNSFFDNNFVNAFYTNPDFTKLVEALRHQLQTVFAQCKSPDWVKDGCGNQMFVEAVAALECYADENCRHKCYDVPPGSLRPWPCEDLIINWGSVVSPT